MVTSLRARLALLIVLAVSPSIAAHLGNGAMLRQDAEEGVRQDAMRLLASIEGEQERIAEGIHLLLDGLAETDVLHAGDAAGCQAYLQRVGLRLPEHLSILATDRRGRVLCSSATGMLGQEIAERDDFRRAMRGGGPGPEPGSVSRFVRNEDGSAAIVFAKPYQDEGGSVAGVVSASLGLSWLEAHFAAMPLPENATVTFADRDGTVVARLPASEQWAGARLPQDYLELLGAADRGVVERTGLDGVDRVIAFSPIATGLDEVFVAVGIDEASALSVIDRATRRGLLLTLLDVVAMLAVASLGVNHFIRRPASRLMAAAGRWRDGDYSARADLRSDVGEIAMLGSAFDRMAAALEDRERIREAAHEAERRMAAVLASTSDGVIEVDGEWRISFLNDRARLFFGDCRAAPGALLWEAFPEMGGTAFERRYRAAVSIQRPTEFEAFSGATGVWFAVRAFPTREGLAIHLQDISARKAQEREIRRAEARHRAHRRHGRGRDGAGRPVGPHPLLQPVDRAHLRFLGGRPDRRPDRRAAARRAGSAFGVLRAGSRRPPLGRVGGAAGTVGGGLARR
jgi:PAS domain-containing protein